MRTRTSLETKLTLSPSGAAQQDPERHGRGQALVEFAIVLPVFFLLIAGMFDFGLGIYSDLTLVNAAREGARIGVIRPGETAIIEARVRAMADNLDGSRLKVTISCERASSSGNFAACTGEQWLPGDATNVKVDYTHQVFFPLLFGTEIPLSSESKMRIE